MSRDNYYKDDYYDEGLRSLHRKLDKLIALNIRLENTTMATKQEVTDVLDAVEAGSEDETNAITALSDAVDRIMNLYQNAAATSSDLDEFKTKAQNIQTTVQANRERIAALVLKGTPADTGQPVPAPVIEATV